MSKYIEFEQRIVKIADKLEDLIEDAEEAKTELQMEMDELEDNAVIRDRDMTQAEKARYDKFEADYMELESLIDTVSDALDYLR